MEIGDYKETPAVNNNIKGMPNDHQDEKTIPDVNNTEKEIPSEIPKENCITVGDETIEIKPTKLKYQRNRTAAFYRVLEVYPLPDILAMEKGIIDPDRDGDKAVFDWCCAATDNASFVKRHYDDMDTGVIERLLEIFKRLNAITDKEEQTKNRMAKERNN